MKTNVMALKRLYLHLFLRTNKFPHMFLITETSIKETEYFFYVGSWLLYHSKRHNSDVQLFFSTEDFEIQCLLKHAVSHTLNMATLPM
jgi:hypothetical protein